jgi:hypothetical protein
MTASPLLLALRSNPFEMHCIEKNNLNSIEKLTIKMAGVTENIYVKK